MTAATLEKKTGRESPRDGKSLFVGVLGAVALGCLAVRAELPLQWESTVFDVPTSYSADPYVTGGETNGVKAVFLSSVPYLGKETRVFAYWGLPAGASAEHPAPAMVLVHGGGGSAFYRWVKFWNDQGYAAISMDLNGHVSGNTVGEEQHGHFKHAWAGPEGCGGNAFIDAADHTLKDQWMYHAVAAVIRSHSFLRAQPGVDADHIGVTGVSWGGVVNCVVAAVDDRFTFAFPVYGCGSLYDDISSWTQASYYVRGVPFSPTGTANARWSAVSDPKHYLPEAKIPVLWLNGTNDRNFSLLSTARSYDQVPGEKHLALRVRLTHNHSATSEQAPEIVAAADKYLRGGVAFPTMVTAAKIAGTTVSATYSDAAGLPVASATLDYTCDNLPIWFSNTWQSVEATVDPATKTVSATLPAGVKYAYLSVETATRVRASTPMLMPLDFARAGKPYPHYIVDNGYVVTNALTAVDGKGVFTKIVSADAEPVATTRADFLAATTGTFFKNGAGRFDIDEAVPNFEGQFHAVGGTLALTVTNVVGKVLTQWSAGRYPSEADGYVVHAGATLAMDATRYVDPSNAIKLNPQCKAIVLEGRGYHDASGRYTQGALFAKANGIKAASFIYWPLGAIIRLADDARIVSEVSEPGEGHTRFTLNNPMGGGLRRKIALDGHALEIVGSDKLTVLSDFELGGGIIADGTVVVTNMLFHFGGGTAGLEGTGTLKLASPKSKVKFENTEKLPASWTLAFATDAKVNAVASAGNGAWGYGDFVTNRTAVTGPIALNGNFMLENGSTCYGYALNGIVSGSGGISYTSANSGANAYIHLVNPANSFQGGASIIGPNTVLGLYNDGALPADGGPLAVRNATVRLLAERGEQVGAVYHLPAATFHADSGKSSRLEQATVVFSEPVVKTGAGTLALASQVTGESLDVREGTVRFAKGRPGLYEQHQNFVANVTDFGLDIWNGAVSRIATNFVDVAGPSTVYELGSPTWARNNIKVYRGYIWNRSGQSQNWSFASIYRPSIRLFIDGVTVIDTGYDVNNNQYAPHRIATIEVTPGAHRFELRLWQCNMVNQAADQKAVDSAVADGWTNWTVGSGLMFDRQGRGSTDMNDYEKLVDPGDGSLFTLTDATHGDSSFANVSVGKNATLDLAGSPCVLESVRGGGGTIQGDVTVTQEWKLNAADLLATSIGLTISGDLVIGAGTKLTVSNPELLAGLGGFTLCKANSVTGTLQVEGMPGWNMQTGSDGSIRFVGTAGVPSLTNTWNTATGPAGNAPATAYDWATASNWFNLDGSQASTAPIGAGRGAQFTAAATPLFVAVPEGLKLTHLKSGAKIYFLGDHEICTSDDSYYRGWTQTPGTYFFGDVTYTGTPNGSGQAYDYLGSSGGGHHAGRLVLAEGSSVATVAPKTNPTRIRCDLWADDSNAKRTNPFEARASLFSQGSIIWYAPRGADEQHAAYDLTVGSAYAKLNGAACALAVGTAVTAGEGVAPGTFLRRVFEGTDWIELSAPATKTVTAAPLTFAAFTPSLTQTIDSQWRGDASIRLSAVKYREEDGCRLVFNRFVDNSAVGTEWGYTAAEGAGGLIPGDIEVVKLEGVPRQTLYTLNNVRLTIDEKTGANGRLTVAEGCTARLTVPTDVTLSWSGVTNLLGTLEKRGDGTLLMPMDTAANAGTLKIDEGVVTLSKTTLAGAEPLTLGGLVLAEGVEFQVPPEGLTVSRLTAAAGATLVGPGKLTVLEGGTSGVPSVRNGAEVEIRMPSLAEEDVLNQDDIWLHLDASDFVKDAAKLPTYLENGTNFVSKWFDTDGRGTYAAQWTRAKEMITKDFGVGDAFIRENAANGLPFVDLGPMTATNGYKNGVLDGVDRSLAFYGADDLIYAQGASDTYWTNPSPHAPPQFKTAFFVVSSDNGGGAPMTADIDNYWSVGMMHESRLGAPMIGQENSGHENNCEVFKRYRMDNGTTTFHVNGETVYPMETPYSGGTDMISMKFNSAGSGRRTGGLGYSGTGNPYAENCAGGLAYGEVILCTNLLTDAAFARVEAYLQQKWFGQDIPGYTVSGESLLVGAGSTMTLSGNRLVTVRTLGGTGTIDGDVKVREGASFVLDVADDGSLGTLMVTGTATFPSAVRVTLNANGAKLLPGTYAILTADRLVTTAAAWSLAEALPKDRRATFALSEDGKSVVLTIRPNGTSIIFK